MSNYINFASCVPVCLHDLKPGLGEVPVPRVAGMGRVRDARGMVGGPAGTVVDSGSTTPCDAASTAGSAGMLVSRRVRGGSWTGVGPWGTEAPD